MLYSVKQDWNQVLDLLGLLTAFSPLIFLLPGRAKLRGRLRACLLVLHLEWPGAVFS